MEQATECSDKFPDAEREKFQDDSAAVSEDKGGEVL